MERERERAREREREERKKEERSKSLKTIGGSIYTSLTLWYRLRSFLVDAQCIQCGKFLAHKFIINYPLFVLLKK